jgi:hypothetical protein
VSILSLKDLSKASMLLDEILSGKANTDTFQTKSLVNTDLNIVVRVVVETVGTTANGHIAEKAL